LLNDLDPDPERLRNVLAGIMQEQEGKEAIQALMTALHGWKLLGS
jgi:hypothetical protein